MALRYPSEWQLRLGDRRSSSSSVGLARLLKSSDSGWAEPDLSSAMQSRAANSVNFIESFLVTLEAGQARRLKPPSAKQVNAISSPTARRTSCRGRWFLQGGAGARLRESISGHATVEMHELYSSVSGFEIPNGLAKV